MNTLFPVEPVYPEGFSYFPDFLSADEEMDLLEEISRTELHVFNFQGFEAKRKVASFGYDWSFERRELSKGMDIPKGFMPVIEKAAGHLGIGAEAIKELLVLEYPVGAVINWHRDAPPFDVIVGLSLRTDCVLKLRPYEKAKQGRGSIVKVPVKRRSLYIMQGAARSEWEHSTAPVKEVRYSVTLRTLRESH